MIFFYVMSHLILFIKFFHLLCFLINIGISIAICLSFNIIFLL